MLCLVLTVSNNWATFSTSTTPSSSALHNNDFTLTCEVKTIPGMSLPVSIEWVLPNGSVATAQGNRTVGSVITTNSTLTSPQEQFCGISPSSIVISSLPMTFDPVRNSDGGTYTCRAVIRVPWMIQQPKQLSATTDMPVTNKYT